MIAPTASSPLPYFAATAPGLEPLTGKELGALKLTPYRIEPGGVAFGGDPSALHRANLGLRTASRVLLRIGTFHASAFYELEKQARRLPWGNFLRLGDEVRIRVTCHKSRLYHSEAVAQRLFDAMLRLLPGLTRARVSDEDEDEESRAPLILARFSQDRCTISVDSSGALLHRRGYRQRIGKAPLRETLAAALLLGAGYTGDTPLLDPFCGSGTIPIEAALIARRIAPGLARSFAFERWDGFDPVRFARLRDELAALALPRAPHPILGSDLDEAVLDAARLNAAQAGVAKDVSFQTASCEAAPYGAEPSLIASNPPYGIRLGESTELRRLFALWGTALRRRAPRATVALLAPRELASMARLESTERLSTRNGGIPVTLSVATPV